MASNLNIRNTITSLVILILLVFLGLEAIKVFSQKKGAIKVDTQARFELPDDEGEALREIDPCSEDPNWETANYTQDRPLYNSSLICNCCYPVVVKCHVVHQLHVKGKELCGKIPPSLATLPYLETANFTQNYVGGSMPPEWTTSMKNLDYLSLYANNLSGPIPIYVYLENMTSPVYVRLENSMYCGTVPPELAKLFKM
ncbi:probable leucine-rich repeat receptor-like serine/threonine-protein kinase At3g14840 isoform X1 [Ziziphus jujuba]|uniref:Probable leucine-rich repeat receptor-like serine/threonine-protein kinase At3g14840 isoform X1 n=1 Tax=Ziziphus jujuba TaxID=326968 RepID=A0ABM3ZVU0_ZIZJJ|nr:probable leucine-rich repeat receptor-like serine/threonine-protein kinase At3g14840 isoform X1 [Ziziphus jujuba]